MEVKVRRMNEWIAFINHLNIEWTELVYFLLLS